MNGPTARRIAAISLVPLAGLLIAACSASPGTPAPASGARSPRRNSDACAAREKDARAAAQAAVSAHRGCQVDADCVTVEIGNGCFDACTDSVSREGEAAVRSALAASDAAGCSKFAADGCWREVPPCAPPQAPSCHGGQCQ